MKYSIEKITDENLVLKSDIWDGNLSRDIHHAECDPGTCQPDFHCGPWDMCNPNCTCHPDY